MFSSLDPRDRYFVVDESNLKLISADPDTGIYAGVYALLSVDISFNSHGFRMILEDEAAISCDGGLVLRSSPHSPSLALTVVLHTEKRPQISYPLSAQTSFES